jgi:hypothetical protein
MWFLKFAAAFFFISAFPCFAYSEDKKAIADALYKDGEQDIRKDWDKSFEYVELERQRKAKAGEPPVSAKTQQEGSDGMKIMLYNKAVITAMCAEESAQASKNADEAISLAKACFHGRVAEMIKSTKLMEYSSTIGAGKVAACEMKARDYKNEVRFVPYGFFAQFRRSKAYGF